MKYKALLEDFFKDHGLNENNRQNIDKESYPDWPKEQKLCACTANYLDIDQIQSNIE